MVKSPAYTRPFVEKSTVTRSWKEQLGISNDTQDRRLEKLFRQPSRKSPEGSTKGSTQTSTNEFAALLISASRAPHTLCTERCAQWSRCPRVAGLAHRSSLAKLPPPYRPILYPYARQRQRLEQFFEGNQISTAQEEFTTSEAGWSNARQLPPDCFAGSQFCLPIVRR